VIRAGYELLGLQTYFTVGPKEARAWTIPVGTKAPQAAGVIHTDFEKGFIRAETIAYDDYVTFNGEAGAKEAGKMRAKARIHRVRRPAFSPTATCCTSASTTLKRAAVAQKTGLLALILGFGKKFIVLILAGLAALGGAVTRMFRKPQT
jgi:hypothetical protein